MLETSDLKYLDSLNQTFKSQESRLSPSSFASHTNSAQCRIIEISKLLCQGITVLVFRAHIDGPVRLFFKVHEEQLSPLWKDIRPSVDLQPKKKKRKKEILKAVWAPIMSLFPLYFSTLRSVNCVKGMVGLWWGWSSFHQELERNPLADPHGEVSWWSRISIVCDLCLHGNEPFCTTLKCWKLLISALMHLKYIHLYSPSVHHL